MILNEAVLEDMRTIVDYMYDIEEKDWEECGKPEEHIFTVLKRLKGELWGSQPKTYTENEVVKIILNLRETLSDLEHKQWSHWEKYREERLNTCVDFSGQLANWRRLREKSYSDLTEKEKQSDQEWADKVISVIINKFMT